MMKELLNDQVKPYNLDENKTVQLTRLFNRISEKYDSFNNLVSLGMAHYWRKKSIVYLKDYTPKHILDVATGTADMLLTACELLQPESITGIDISEEMMKVGQLKVNKSNPSSTVHFETQDSSQLTFVDNSFDAVTISFGIRNLEKLSASLQEINRVLEPGGHLLIVEVNPPTRSFIKFFYKLYIKLALIASSSLLGKSDFRYLTNSMGAFPQGIKLIDILSEFNFELIKYKRFTFDVCSAYLLVNNK